MTKKKSFAEHTPLGYVGVVKKSHLTKKEKVSAVHPDHGVHKKRLNRVRGQIDGIERMIEERRYCPDILIQLRAAAKALQAIESEILATHVQGCVKAAIAARDESEAVEKVEEIMDLIKR